MILIKDRKIIAYIKKNPNLFILKLIYQKNYGNYQNY